MTNQLGSETSPYLLQHVDNPVDWYPWGEEALARARAENKPILLSIGYAACHWCHVMAHESFEDEVTAAYMNEHFVNIKVDREERPDLDSIYMGAVVAMTGQGGWPMTVVLTPEGAPFFGGTYFPDKPRYGMPSFRQVLASVTEAWLEKEAAIRENAGEITDHLQRELRLNGAGALDETIFDGALKRLLTQFDQRRGGFGQAPKFPQPMVIEYLLRMHHVRDDSMALHMAEYTLMRMAHGGIYDHLGGGFARYSTDDKWLVPHFEKMLYDNAQLARVYVHAYQVTGNALYRQVVEETLDYVVREMRHEGGGFYSSQDADSEGVEGKFYVWQAAEIRAVLGSEADLFMQYYDVSEGGNWEGNNILHVPRTLLEVAAATNILPETLRARLAAARSKLYGVRAGRIWPGLDDKVLTAWNGLMLAAFAEAGRVLDRPDYIAVAVENAQFLYDTMRRPDGRLNRTWKAGHEARLNAYLEDYAYLADGLLALYQATFDGRWFSWALSLVETMRIHFNDSVNGGFFDTSDDHEALVMRPKDVQDNAAPSGNAMAVNILLQTALYTGRGELWTEAEAAVSALAGALSQHPTGFGHWLNAAAFIMGEPVEIAISGHPDAADTAALISVAQAAYRPHQVIAVGADPTIPLLAGRPAVDGRAAAYVCRRFVCDRPVTEPRDLRAKLTRPPVTP